MRHALITVLWTLIKLLRSHCALSHSHDATTRQNRFTSLERDLVDDSSFYVLHFILLVLKKHSIMIFTRLKAQNNIKSNNEMPRTVNQCKLPLSALRLENKSAWCQVFDATFKWGFWNQLLKCFLLVFSQFLEFFVFNAKSLTYEMW